MPWDIQPSGDIVIAHMNSNAVNKMNKAFFDDAHAFASVIEASYPDRPIVLASASAKAFSAGLDFEHAFALFASGDRDAVRAFIGELLEVYLRLFALPNPVIAAVNGAAVAGGFILMCCADHRIAARGHARFAVNEVPLGLPMPPAFMEIIRHAVDTRVTEEIVLRGHFFDPEEALRLGVVHELAEKDVLLDRACDRARAIARESATAYRLSKMFLRQPVIERAREVAARFEELLVQGFMSEDGIRARAAAFARLKGKD